MKDVSTIKEIPCIVLREIGYHDWHKAGEVINVSENHVADMVKHGCIKVIEPSKDSYYTSLKRTDDLGRVQIPKNVRELLDIQEGDELEVSVNSFYQEITIKKIL
jgi:AbrB family looped-hinge helix DNA binding protein